jgi:hypothetical protein
VLTRGRVAQLIVTHPGGRRRGSGYRVTGESVLTAAHLVEGAGAVRVRFEPDLPGEWTTDAVSWWADPRSDVAVVSIPSRPDEEPLSPARFGRIDDRAAVLAVQAVGFPRWKMRTYDGTVPAAGDSRPRYRDAYHAAGSVAVLSNWREGTLEVVVPAAPADPGGDVSPWEGMSGAALWVGERIVGIVAEHHPGDGPARLAAARLDLILDRLNPDRRSELRALLPTLPEHAAALPDVVPAPAGGLITTAYRAQLADIAPDMLYDREPELAELTRFCAGDAPYAWWQAGPWAGKSALLSWLALHPPAAVDVVSFFITSRYAGQSDSDAFTDALLEQLAAFTGEPPQAVLEARVRRGHMLRLLQAAARRCMEVGRRLLVVVDGLDEDTSSAAGVDRPTIAALLPRRLPPEVRVLVASRPHPDLPGDVPGDHPLRTITPRALTVSPHARHIKIAAKDELDRLLKGPPFQRAVLGLITASGGGLTGRDLEELTGQPPYELDLLLGGAFGRSLDSRTPAEAMAGRPAQRVYVFAHGTLRETAERQYGARLADYRDRLHSWAVGYRANGWPADTPTYLLLGYPGLLKDTGDVTRLLGCATDPARQARMLELTGGDHLALSEIAATARLIARQPEPDLGALLRLAIARDDLAERNVNMPTDLPAVWAVLGRPDRAIALANGITDPDRRAFALRQLVTALAARRDQDRAWALAAAEAAAGEIDDPERRAHALSGLASAAAVADPDRAERLLDRISTPSARDLALSGLAAAAAAADPDRAERLAHQITDPRVRAPALSELARVAAAAGDTARAAAMVAASEAAAREIPDPDRRAHVLRELAAPIAAAGDQERAERLAHEITNRGHRDFALDRLAAAVAAAGNPDRAERLAREITEPADRARALRELAAAIAAARDPVRAMAVATAAETAAREITRASDRDRTLSELAGVFAAAGDHDRALRLAHEMTDPGNRARALSGVAGAVAAADAEQAAALSAATEATVREIADPAARAWALDDLARAATAAGDHDRAERLAREITNPERRARALSAQAEALAAGDPVRAMAVATAAETAARDVTRRPNARDRALSDLARVVAAAGDHDRAERLAREIPDPTRAWVLRDIAKVVAAAGDPDRAEHLAREIRADFLRMSVLEELAVAVAAAGDPDRAERLARGIPDPHWQAQALSELAVVVAAAGDHSRAVALVAAAAAAAREIDDDDGRAEVLREVTVAAATAGDPGLAERLAGEIPDHDLVLPGSDRLLQPIPNDRALREQAEALAAAGAHDPAERLARTIIDRSYRAQALGAVAGAVAAAGEHDRAERLAREITNLEGRARALSAVASGIVSSCGGQPLDQSPSAKTACIRLLAEVITSPYWQAALPVVARIALPALQGVCDVLLAKAPGHPPEPRTVT